ncbi:MAG: DNA translocase FtsK 4TM domain-containing protein, partial [Algoriphagus sp.]
MASESPKTNTFRKKSENTPKTGSEQGKSSSPLRKIDLRQVGIILGVVLISTSIFLLFSFISYLMNGPQDQSLIMDYSNQDILEAARQSKNWLGYLGAQASAWMIFRWFGIAGFLFPPFLFLLGFRWIFGFSLYSLTRYSIFSLFFAAW